MSKEDQMRTIIEQEREIERLRDEYSTYKDCMETLDIHHKAERKRLEEQNRIYREALEKLSKVGLIADEKHHIYRQGWNDCARHTQQYAERILGKAKESSEQD